MNSPATSFPVVKAVAYALAHTPGLVRYGSKPEREIRKDAAVSAQIGAHLRSYEQACAYAPNQVFVGAMPPEALWDLERPWWRAAEGGVRFGPFGEIMPEAELYGLLRFVDDFDIVVLEEAFLGDVRERLAAHPLFSAEELGRLGPGVSRDEIEARIAGEGAWPLEYGGRSIGCIRPGHEEDPHLAPGIVLENLACKATGVLAMRWLLGRADAVPAEAVDYVINTGEEAVGDRYQRGAGNLAKAMAERSGCLNSTGADLKAFCCGPIHGLVTAAALVHAGVFANVLVVGGGALAKLGMKFRGHLASDMPVLEDTLASFAILIGAHDDRNPQIRLDAIGKHDVRHSAAAQAIATALVAAPLDKLGRTITDIGKYAVELHNPEITEPAGSGNVARHNYRIIASLAVMRREWPREAIDEFERAHGLPGFCPTQGHVPSAVPYLGHAREAMLQGSLRSAMFVGKGSLFLGKMTHLSDGMSFVLEAPQTSLAGSD